MRPKSIRWQPCLVGLAGLACVIGGCVRPKAQSQTLRVEPPAPPVEPTESEKRRLYADAMQSGVERVDRGDYGVALGFFESALKVAPDSIEARLALGACYESIGDPIRAIREYRAILATNPNDADAYANLGTSYIKLYHREKNSAWLAMADDAWNRSLQLNPNQPDVRQYVASLPSPHGDGGDAPPP